MEKKNTEVHTKEKTERAEDSSGGRKEKRKKKKNPGNRFGGREGNRPSRSNWTGNRRKLELGQTI